MSPWLFFLSNLKACKYLIQTVKNTNIIIKPIAKVKTFIYFVICGKTPLSTASSRLIKSKTVEKTYESIKKPGLIHEIPLRLLYTQNVIIHNNNKTIIKSTIIPPINNITLLLQLFNPCFLQKSQANHKKYENHKQTNRKK